MGWFAFPAPSIEQAGKGDGVGLGDGVNWEPADCGQC